MACQEATLMTSFEVCDGQKLSQVRVLKYSSTKHIWIWEAFKDSSVVTEQCDTIDLTLHRCDKLVWQTGYFFLTQNLVYCTVFFQTVEWF